MNENNNSETTIDAPPRDTPSSRRRNRLLRL
jgi:hypothetical protein